MTKIIATVGPTSEHRLAELHAAGAQIFRLNLSHNTREWHTSLVARIREQTPQAKVLIDHRGPEIRTGELDRPLPLRRDDLISFVSSEAAHNPHNNMIFCNYAQLHESVSVGDTLQLDGGKWQVVVSEVAPGRVSGHLQQNALLGSRRHINLPGLRILLPTISERDSDDILYYSKLGVDYFALSFVRTAADVEQCRELIRVGGGSAQVIAKVECCEAIDNACAIIAAADGVMVARGDLGVETDYWRVPVLQRKLLRIINDTPATFGVVATGMLRSMLENSRPSRAEVSDITTAVWEGADYTMLSDETTVGEYPVESVAVMQKIIEHAAANTDTTQCQI